VRGGYFLWAVDLAGPFIELFDVSSSISHETDGGSAVALKGVGKGALVLKPAAGAVLSPAQIEFNRLMAQLESARVKLERERVRLDRIMDALTHQLMPLIEETHRLDFELIMHLQNALSTYKLTQRRRESLEDLLRGRAGDLVADSCGLAPAQLETLQKLMGEIDPDWIERESEEMGESFDNLRAMMEETAREAGIEIDLSDIDLGEDPEEAMRKLHERFEAAAAADRPRPRKPTKSQLERERKQQAVAEAKQRDLKTLYKQLAKVLHPDLETNPDLRANKEEWMKRLTSAYAAGDLRELLRIEMEWLGEESSNLAAAGDEKLKVYSLILKEQIDEVKSRTYTLKDEPQYSSLRRIMDDFSRHIPRTDLLKRSLVDKVRDTQELLKSLQKGDAVARRILHQWLDVHSEEMEDDLWLLPF
jgi:hypothetical protein